MRFSKDKWYWPVIGLLSALLLAAILWGQYSREQASARLESERTALAAQWQERFNAQAKTSNEEKSEDAKTLLRLLAVPTGWITQREMQGNNYGQIRAYFNDLVGYPGVRNIELVDSAGKIVVSTDKAREGTDVGNAYPVDMLNADKPFATQNGEHQFMVAAPVFGLSAKEGTVILQFAKSDQ